MHTTSAANAAQRRRETALNATGVLSVRLLNALVCLAAFTASWTAVAFAGFNVVDYLLAAALVALVGARLSGSRLVYIEPWMGAPAVAALAATILHVAFSGSGFSPWQDLLRLLLSTTVIALLVTAVSTGGRRHQLETVLAFWAAGAVANAAAAVAEDFGVLDLSTVLTQPTGDRLSGLSSHPNSIAFTLCLAAPVLLYLSEVQRSRVTRLAWIAGLLVAVWGLALADSRSGWIVALPVLGLGATGVISRSRFSRLAIPIGIIAVTGIAIYLPRALAGTRLATGAADSDTGRIAINRNAFETFASSPIFGGGFENQSGVAVPLMVFSAGGAILAVGYYWFALRSAPILWANRSTPVAQAGLLALGAFLAFGVLNPVFAERATFWPPLVAALAVRAHQAPLGSPWRTGPRLLGEAAGALAERATGRNSRRDTGPDRRARRGREQ